MLFTNLIVQGIQFTLHLALEVGSLLGVLEYLKFQTLDRGAAEGVP